MKQSKLKKAQVGGLNILLIVTATLFVIGMLIMTFVLVGAKLNDSGTYAVNSTAYIVVSDTADALADATDFFPIFIVIASILVLILMIVLIIVSLRGAGMMGGKGGA